jgi:hypothetical protein
MTRASRTRSSLMSRLAVPARATTSGRYARRGGMLASAVNPNCGLRNVRHRSLAGRASPHAAHALAAGRTPPSLTPRCSQVPQRRYQPVTKLRRSSARACQCFCTPTLR